MFTDKLTLRTLSSPYLNDQTLGLILSWDNVDSNFIHLKGLDIKSGSTIDGTTLRLARNNGDDIQIDLSTLSSDNYYTTGATFNPSTNEITFNRNDSQSAYSVELTGLASSGETYTNLSPTPNTIGGISAGSTFSAQTTQQMWDALLYPYQTPSFSNFYLNGWTASRYEVGTDIPTSQTFIWSTSNSGNITPNSISINGYNLTTLTGLANDGSESVTFNSVVTRSTAGSYTWTISGQNTKGGSFSRNDSVRWDWLQYWGQSSNTSLTEAQIKALTSSRLIPGNVLGNYSFPVSGYKYWCYADDSYSAPSSFVDIDTGFGVSMYGGYGNSQNGISYDLVSITNSLGKTINYRVYRTQNMLGGSVNISIS